MARLHQINRLNYLEHTNKDIQLSLQKGDAILLIEEGVLRVTESDLILQQAEQLDIPVYRLEKDALAYGNSHLDGNNSLLNDTLISTQQWVELTEKYNHIAW